MAHDVFISYSSIDKTAADTVCSILEQNGINCWIAPRDITPGLDFAEAIIDGIKTSKQKISLHESAMDKSIAVLPFTNLSNDPEQALHWLEKAYEERAPGLPYAPGRQWYDEIKEDTRFRDLCRKINLPYQ